MALQLGAAHALDQSQAKSTAETVESLRAVFHEGPDIVIDCVGLSSTLTVRCVHTSLEGHILCHHRLLMLRDSVMMLCTLAATALMYLTEVVSCISVFA